jgi:hypothetical protein
VSERACRHHRVNVIRGYRLHGNGTADVSERCYQCGKVRRALFVRVEETSKAKLGPWHEEHGIDTATRKARGG